MRVTHSNKAGKARTPKVSPVVVDELRLAPREARQVYQRIQAAFNEHGAPYLDRITNQTQVLMRDLGVTFGLYREEGKQDHVVPFDPFPRVIAAEEWRKLSRGIQQRLRVWNAFFRDIYDMQEVLKAEVVPFELIYDDPSYLRQMVGLRLPHDSYVHVAAFDLARDAQGNWVVIEDFVANTTGASYALQGRHVLSQVIPDLLESADVCPINNYSTSLLEHLRRHAPYAASEPRVVLLSPGYYNQAYYEHSFLARQMGIPLVRGSDMIVLNSRVFLKTIGGLEPIDVIYRRIDEDFIDPVAFRHDSQLGVPGLLSCVRKGTVTVANAIGTGLGYNRALADYLPKLARFYLNESLEIPAIDRYLCFDRDQREMVTSHLDDYCITTISDRSMNKRWWAAKLTQAERAELLSRIEENPAQYVAEPSMPFSQLPVTEAGNLAKHHAGMRLFAFGGLNEQVFPLALTRYSTESDSVVISSGLGGGIKDTWILRDRKEAEQEAALTVSSRPRRLRLSSRIADSLFWMGRYAERAENTTRILKVLQLVQLEDPSGQMPEQWASLWEALARATGHPTHFFKNSPLLRKQAVSHYLLLDRKNPASVIRCLEVCRHNAANIRESVPPEVWVVLNRLYQVVEAKVQKQKGYIRDDEEFQLVQQLQEDILNQLDALIGAASKNMLRDDGWHFWSVGTHVERSMITALVMRQVFLKRQDKTGHTRRDGNLDALLRMLACQYAYRSLFQSRPAVQNVAVMLLQDPQLPRSVLSCLLSIRHSLETVFGSTATLTQENDLHTPLRRCARLIGEVEFADLTPYFEQANGNGSRAPRLRNWLDTLGGQLWELSLAISDHYLNHQTFNVLR